MKIQISKSQWEELGKKAGWIKVAGWLPMPEAGSFYNPDTKEIAPMKTDGTPDLYEGMITPWDMENPDPMLEESVIISTNDAIATALRRWQRGEIEPVEGEIVPFENEPTNF